MTREEAIKIFLNRGWIEVEGGTYFDGDKWREAIMVISDYFQNEYKEPALDKIRAEIKQMNFHFGDCYDFTGIIIGMVLEVIDKYRAEAEEHITKEEKAIKAAKYLREYCKSIPADCVGCEFISKDPISVFWKGCLLNDSDHLPETWELEKVETA